jgi:hypothetical protein
MHVPKRAHPLDRDAREEAEEAGVAAPAPPGQAAEVLTMQRGVGNAAVSRMLSTGGPATVARWKDLGTESWKIPSMTRREMTVWTGTKEEWSSRLDNIDDDDEYHEDLWGFLMVCNNPSIVGRTTPPGNLGSAEQIQYANTITRVPTQAEKLAFLQALFEKSGDLDLWHGGSLEGGTFVIQADEQLSQFIANNQDLYLMAMAQEGRPVKSSGVEALAEQGGKKAAMSMITNAGATAHKGVDLLVTASRKEEGQERETAHAVAYELIRNSGRTIAAVLKQHDDAVEFQQGITAAVFDHVWGLIPGGGTLRNAGMAVLKYGLGEALKKASEDDEPSDQAEAINSEFVVTCNKLVQTGEMKSAEMQDAINGFEAVRKP